MRFISVIFAAALFATPALAADEAQSPVRQACAADLAKFCAGQDPRSDAGRACSRQHRAEFTPACQSAMDARRQERRERLKIACAIDLAKFCKSGAESDERPGRCLRDHEAELSETCKAALPNHRS